VRSEQAVIRPLSADMLELCPARISERLAVARVGFGDLHCAPWAICHIRLYSLTLTLSRGDLTCLCLQASEQKEDALRKACQMIWGLEERLGHANDQIEGLDDQLLQTDNMAMEIIEELEQQLAEVENIAGDWMRRAKTLETMGSDALRQAERVDPVGMALGEYDWATQGVEAFEVCSGPVGNLDSFTTYTFNALFDECAVFVVCCPVP
jgi:hypothetical protein